MTEGNEDLKKRNVSTVKESESYNIPITEEEFSKFKKVETVLTYKKTESFLKKFVNFILFLSAIIAILLFFYALNGDPNIDVTDKNYSIKSKSIDIEKFTIFAAVLIIFILQVITYCCLNDAPMNFMLCCFLFGFDCLSIGITLGIHIVRFFIQQPLC